MSIMPHHSLIWSTGNVLILSHYLNPCWTSLRMQEYVDILRTLQLTGYVWPDAADSRVSYRHISLQHNFTQNTWDPFYWHGLTLIPAWISSCIHCEVWDEIVYPIPNYTGCPIDVWEWISNFIPHFILGDYLSMLGLKSNHVSIRTLIWNNKINTSKSTNGTKQIFHCFAYSLYTNAFTY